MIFMKSKKWNLFVIGCSLGLIIFIAGITILIDPFLHYGDGLGSLQYPLKDERYQNDGIARHYEYNAIITGTSMCQNFLASEFDTLWGAQTIKLTHSGASYHESCNTIERALSYQEDVEYVLCSLDGSFMNTPWDYNTYEGYPTYLYDNNPFNDVKYLLNKEVVPKTIAVINYTRVGNKTTSKDEYGFWGNYKTYGKESVLKSFVLQEKTEHIYMLTKEDKAQIEENITKNFLQLAQDNPDVTFYFFFPPYSICHWEGLQRSGQLGLHFEAQKMVTEILLSMDNVEIYDFSKRTDIIGNLDNYTDTLHYGPWVNSEILEMIHTKSGRLTKDNCEEYWQEVYELYQDYDYSLYKD